MTTQEIKSLKAYLTNCLEPALYSAQSQELLYENEKTVASKKGEDYRVQHAKGMEQWARGKASALEDAIDTFKELFAEELAELEPEAVDYSNVTIDEVMRGEG